MTCRSAVPHTYTQQDYAATPPLGAVSPRGGDRSCNCPAFWHLFLVTFDTTWKGIKKETKIQKAPKAGLRALSVRKTSWAPAAVPTHPAATPYCVEHRRHSSRLCCRADACAAGGVGGTHQQKKFIVITFN